MPRLGVLGWPVAHSRSPAMHTAAFKALGMTGWAYEPLAVEPEAFCDYVRAMPAQGFVGANVTIPHKEAALALADDVTDDAQAIGAVNTLSFQDGCILGANTDAPGFLAAIGNEIPAKAMLLGAGGSARAVAYALERAGSEVLIWNRTKARAEALGTAVDAPVEADMLINCTSLGLGDPSTGIKAFPLQAESLVTYATVVDLVYRQGMDTELIAAAKAAGCAVVDGLEVLIRQGALSFEIWTGRPAPLDEMRTGARMHDDELGVPTSAGGPSGQPHAGSGS